MPQFPSWKLPTAAWTDAVGSRTSQMRDTLAELATRGRDAGGEFTTRAGALVDELRRRIKVLDLATKEDVEAQTRVARNRVSYVLKEFLAEQRGHEQQLLETLRTELHEELQSFAAAIDDDLFAGDGKPDAVPKRSRGFDFLDDDDEDDDEFELDEYEANDYEFDVSDDGAMIRQSLLDAADG